jgi:4-hydroxy-tetrahydrodipicolinate synthase
MPKHPATFSPRGMWPVLYAYFDASNTLDQHAIHTQIDRTIEAGASGIVILGLATEVNRLSLDEKHCFIRWTSNHIAGRVPLAVTITGDTADAQVALADHAAGHGASSLILQPPSMRDKPESFYFDFFADVMSRVKVPVGIQNAPEYLGVVLSVQSLVALATQCSAFQWLKGEGPATIIQSTIQRLREQHNTLPVFNGRGGQELIDNLRAGCAGLIIAPDSFDWQAAIGNAFTRDDHAKAQALYERILPSIVFVMQSLDALTCYGKRIAAWRMGFDVAHDRGIRPTSFGLECARRFASALGPFADQRETLAASPRPA